MAHSNKFVTMAAAMTAEECLIFELAATEAGYASVGLYYRGRVTAAVESPDFDPVIECPSDLGHAKVTVDREIREKIRVAAKVKQCRITLFLRAAIFWQATPDLIPKQLPPTPLPNKPTPQGKQKIITAVPLICPRCYSKGELQAMLAKQSTREYLCCRCRYHRPLQAGEYREQFYPDPLHQAPKRRHA
jgi:hypothetical protein